MKETELKIKLDDLSFGEFKAMKATSALTGIFRKLNPDRLEMLVKRIETEGAEGDKVTLALFKLLLFFSREFHSHLNKDKKLQEALKKEEWKDFLNNVMPRAPGNDDE
jgi:hypothetical protein